MPRDEPVEAVDSGWQFLTKETVRPDELKIWQLSEVLEYEPSLSVFMNVPTGTRLWRESLYDTWMIKTPDSKDEWLDGSCWQP